jgi:hypothetical protein
MGVPTLEVGYTSATSGRGDHEVHKGHVVGGGKIPSYVSEDIASNVDRTRPNNGRYQRARTRASNVHQQEEGTWEDHELMENRKL